MAIAVTACDRSREAGDEGQAALVQPTTAEGQGPSDNARTEIPSLDAPQVSLGAIEVDGALDEDIWSSAAETEPFVAPGDGAARPDSPVSAQAWLAWDRRALYAAFVVEDREPTSPFDRDATDPHIWSAASGVELMIQPGDHDDNREYFEIQVGVNGAVWDTKFDDYNRPITGEGAARRFGHQDWDAQLDRSVTVHDDHYVVELALPWSSIVTDRAATPPAAGDVWRINLYSFRDGQQHALAWSPILGQGNFHRASRFGRVTFAAQ